jgi:hypothetical protein
MVNKLKNIPKIYYLNLDEREDRKEYMETQFDYWEISNYKRYSASDYKASDFDNWKHLIIGCKEETYRRERRHLVELATAMSTLDMIKYWLTNSDEKYCILMEDDYDLYPIEYWHFDWEYLMNNIPYDWDCIQLGFENHHTIPCFLHPILSGHSTGPCMINRPYAEKLIRLHCVDEKYNLYHNISNWWWKRGLKLPTVTVDYFLCHNGRTYSIPLITVNEELGSYEENYVRTDRKDLTFTRKAYKKWWTELRDEYTLDEFFSFGKPNDKFIKKSDV